jgi:hypothetical protein
LNKLSSGVDLLTVTGGHTLDLAEMLLGPIIEVKTRAETRWPVVKLIDSGEESVREVPDYVAVIEPEATAVPSGTVETAINVGEVYAQLARDLHDGAYRTPGFDHALANARLIEAVRAAEWGERRKPETRTDRNAR